MSAKPLAVRISRDILLLVFSPQLAAYSTPFTSILHTSQTTIAYGINESKGRLRVWLSRVKALKNVMRINPPAMYDLIVGKRF